MLFTIAHELTHFMRQWSPEHFTKIAKIVFKHGGMKGNVSELVALKMKKAADKGKPISYDIAMEELVADGMETILKDGKVIEFMAEVKKKDRAAWEKIKGWFKNLEKFLRKLVWAYKGHSAQTTEGARVADFSENLLRQIEQIWAEGAVAAGENYRTEGTEKNTTEDGGVKFMSRDIESVTEDTVREDLADVFNGNNVTAASYIPLAKTTPFAVRYITGYMADRPIIVDKKKAYFDMREDGKFKEDSSHHYHGMGIDGFLDALVILNDPEFAILEDMGNGQYHYAFISSNENGEELCVVFQMNVTKNVGQMNGYPSGYYNLDITEFVATDEWLERHGVEPGTSYKDYLLSFPENSIAYDRSIHLEQLEKARLIDSESAGLAASYDNNRASGDRVTQPGTIVKSESVEALDVELDAKTESADANFQTAEKNTTEDGGVKFMVRENVVDANGNVYGKVVRPGLTIYEKVKHSKKTYVSYLHTKIFKRTFNVSSNDGSNIRVEFAKANERVKKDGDKTPRRVLGELEATSDRLKMIAIINIRDLLKNSEPLTPSNENSHQWLDAEGWRDRISYMEDNNVIYPVILHIPKTRDGRYLLYDISVKKDEGSTVDIDATALASSSDGRASTTHENESKPAVKSIEPSGGRLAQLDPVVKSESIEAKDVEVAKQMPKVIDRITNEIVKHSSALANQTVAAQKNTTQKDGVKFSQREFNKAVDDIVYSDDNAPFDYRNVYMGETPQVLLDIGFIQLPMTITSKHIYTIANKDGRFSSPNDHYHELGATRVKELPEMVRESVVTFVEKDNPQRVVIVTSKVDSSGQPIMVAVEYSGQTNYNEVRIYANPVTTALGKKENWFLTQITEAINDGRLLQADKKRSQESPSGLWAQCPEGLWSSDFTTNIEQFKQNVKRFLPKEKQIRKAWAAVRESEEKTKKSERGDGTSNRSLLANAFEGMAQNDIELNKIREYKGRIKILNEYEEKLAELNADIRKTIVIPTPCLCHT